MSALTSGLATFGAVDTYMRSVCAVIVGIIMVVIGAMIRKNPDKHTQQTTGVTHDVNCYMHNNKTRCQAQIDYTVDNKKYTFTGSYSEAISNGQTVSLFYDPKNPQDAVVQPIPQVLGILLIVFGLIVIIAAIGFAYFFSKLGQQGQAVVGGLEAAGEVASLLQPNKSN